MDKFLGLEIPHSYQEQVINHMKTWLQNINSDMVTGHFLIFVMEQSQLYTGIHQYLFSVSFKTYWLILIEECIKQLQKFIYEYITTLNSEDTPTVLWYEEDIDLSWRS